MKKIIHFMSGLVIVLLLASCTAVANTGSDGIDGTNANAVYLEDSDGNRFYSGSTIFSGSVIDGDASIKTNLTLHISNGSSLSLTGGSDNYIQYGDYERLIQYSDFDGVSLSYDTYTSNASGLGYLTLDQSSVSASISGDTSTTFSLTLQTITNSENIGNFTNHVEFQKQFVIPVDIGEETYNFTFEVTGDFDYIYVAF